MSNATVPPVAAPLERDGWNPWVRRAIIVVVLICATWFLVWSTRHGIHGVDGPADNPAVVERVPGPGARVLQQSQVGAQLKPGYDGRVSINGVEVPETQMEGALDPSSSTAQKYGVRPNNKEQVLFLPGPGKIITRLKSGSDTVSIRFWKIEQGEKDSQTISWLIYVS